MALRSHDVAEAWVPSTPTPQGTAPRVSGAEEDGLGEPLQGLVAQEGRPERQAKRNVVGGRGLWTWEASTRLLPHLSLSRQPCTKSTGVGSHCHHLTPRHCHPKKKPFSISKRSRFSRPSPSPWQPLAHLPVPWVGRLGVRRAGARSLSGLALTLCSLFSGSPVWRRALAWSSS